MQSNCWLFAGVHFANGYGAIWNSLINNYELAHRVVYETFVGKIPQGLHIDHLCRVRNCINPEHMETVTIGENVLRGVGPAAMNANKTHCKNGHAFTKQNTYHYLERGRLVRHCRSCRQVADHKRKAKVKLERSLING